MSEVFSWGLGVAACLLIRRLLVALGAEKGDKQILAFLSALFLITLLAAPLPKMLSKLSTLSAEGGENAEQSRVVADAARGLEEALARKLSRACEAEGLAVSQVGVTVRIGAENHFVVTAVTLCTSHTGEEWQRLCRLTEQMTGVLPVRKKEGTS